MKVLLLAPSPHLAGGISRWTRHILNYYQKHKENCDLDYLCTTQSKYSVKRTFVTRIYYGFINYFRVILIFKHNISLSNYDVVHITTSASISLLKDLFLINIARRKNIKSVVHFRFGRIPELVTMKNWEWKLLKKVINCADVAVTIDLKSYMTLISEGFTNVANLPNPISDEILNTINEKKNIAAQPRSIIFVGQMLETKGIYELVEVCSKIPDIKLNMFGLLPKGVKKKLLDLAGYDSDKWLNIAGEVDYDLVVINMMTSFVFVLPTYTEGFPNVILESMACGCPIVACGVGAIPEMLAIDSDTPCGICIEPRNKVQLKEAIEYMLDNPESAKIFGDRAKQRVVENYSIDSIWESLLGIWGNC